MSRSKGPTDKAHKKQTREEIHEDFSLVLS